MNRDSGVRVIIVKSLEDSIAFINTLTCTSTIYSESHEHLALATRYTQFTREHYLQFPTCFEEYYWLQFEGESSGGSYSRYFGTKRQYC